MWQIVQNGVSDATVVSEVSGKVSLEDKYQNTIYKNLTLRCTNVYTVSAKSESSRWPLPTSKSKNAQIKTDQS